MGLLTLSDSSHDNMSGRSLSAVALVLIFALAQCQRFPDRGANRSPDSERDQTAAPCAEKVMDIYFVLDSSNSIYVHDYDSELEFVKGVVSRLDISSRHTRVGMLTFSDDFTRPTISLTQFNSKRDVLNAVTLQNLPYRTGLTNTHLAIRYVREDPEFRRDITKVMVVVTDGGSRSPGATAREARLAREEGFYMFVVGIGQFLEESEWRNIASDPDSSFIFNITSFNLLDDIKYTLPPRACALPPIIMGGSCGIQRRADLIFAAAPGGSQEAMQLIDYFTERTSDDDNLLQTSYVIDFCDGAENVPLGSHDRLCSRELDSLEPTDDTNQNLFASVKRIARNSRSPRTNQPQVVVLFLNSAMMVRERSGYDMANELRALQSDNVQIVMVNLGVPRRQRNIINNFQRFGPIVTFSQGSLVPQIDAKNSFIDSTCDALNNFGRNIPDPSGLQ